jgi:broad specificity phosphatase PhoE
VPSVLLVRHAQGSFGGEDYDVLSEHGHAQTAALLDDLRLRGARIDRLVAGSLARQRDTIAPVAEAYGLEVESDPRWDEYLSEDILVHHSETPARLDRSAETGEPMLTSREFQALLDAALLAWIGAGEEGPAGETWPAFTGRCVAALEAVTGSLGSGEVALVCTSGGPLGALAAALMGLPDTALVAFNRVCVNTGITRLTHGRGGTNLVSFNEHGHLERGGTSLVTYR